MLPLFEEDKEVHRLLICCHADNRSRHPFSRRDEIILAERWNTPPVHQRSVVCGMSAGRGASTHSAHPSVR
jgi:hypothetical protein